MMHFIADLKTCASQYQHDDTTHWTEKINLITFMALHHFSFKRCLAILYFPPPRNLTQTCSDTNLHVLNRHFILGHCHLAAVVRIVQPQLSMYCMRVLLLLFVFTGLSKKKAYSLLIHQLRIINTFI